jgi:hypothetical protein
MKSDRRHELQTNELADWVGHQIEQLIPYTRAIVGGIVGIIVIAIAYTVVSYQQSAASGRAWQSYLGALMERDVDTQVADLEDVATREQGNPAGLWALQTQADLDLDRASRMLFSSRDEALKLLDRSQKNYEKVETESQRNPTLLERARFGLGQVYECQGSLEKAKAKYEQVVKSKTTPAYSKLAARRLEAVSDPKVVDFYAWFEKQKPAPPPPRGGMLPGGNLGDLPDRPDIKFPDFGGGADAPAAKEDAEKPATDAKPAEEKPADEKPASEKPAEEKPAEAKPVEEKPAAEKPADAKPTAEKPAEKPASAPAEKPAEKPAN